MENPCIKCSLSQNEKAACCGCPEGLKWEREQIKHETIKPLKSHLHEPDE